jgi:hypothetical protein
MNGIATPTDDQGADGGRGAMATIAGVRARDGGRWVQLQPDTLLPAQWHRNFASDSALVPEKRLLLAILEEAVATLQRYVLDSRRRGRRLYHEAETWVLSDDVSWPCSFSNVCDALGIDPGYLRRGVMRWRDRRRADPCAGTRSRYAFRRLGGSRTRTVGRPVGLGRRTAAHGAFGS